MSCVFEITPDIRTYWWEAMCLPVETHERRSWWVLPTRCSAQSVVDQSCIKMAATFSTLPPNFSFTWGCKFRTHHREFEIWQFKAYFCQISQVYPETVCCKYSHDWFFSELLSWKRPIQTRWCSWDVINRRQLPQREVKGALEQGSKAGEQEKRQGKVWTIWMPLAAPMWKSVQMSVKVDFWFLFLRSILLYWSTVPFLNIILYQACLLLAAKVWSFVAYLFKKQYRTVSFVASFLGLGCAVFHCGHIPSLFSDPAVQGHQVWHLPSLPHLQTQTQHGAEKGQENSPERQKNQA